MNHEPDIADEERGARALVILKLLLRLRGCIGVEHLEQLKLDDRGRVERPAVFPRVPATQSVVSDLRQLKMVNALSAQISLLQFV